MRMRIVRSKVLLVLILSLFLTLEGLLPVVAFATDEPSEQEVVGEAEAKGESLAEDDASAIGSMNGPNGEPVEPNSPAGYDVNATPSEDAPALMSSDSIRSGDWSYYESVNSSNEQIYVIDHYYGSNSSIALPATLDGLPMSKVSFFYDGLPNCVTEVKFPASIREIGAYGFAYSRVSSVVIPDNSQLEIIGESAFYNTPLTSFVLPKALKELGHDAFANTLMKSFTLNDDLGPMFYLEHVVSGNNEFDVSRHFNPCPGAPIGLKFNVSPSSRNYKTVDGALLSKDGTILYAQYSDLGGGQYVVPSSVQILGQWSMELNKTFSSISLPSGLTDMEGGCLYGTAIIELSMPDSVTRVQGLICEKCDDLTDVTISNNLKELGESAGWECFYGCTKLKDVRLGSKLRVIGNSCFAGSAIRSIDLPDSLEQINYGVFADCKSLASVTGGKNLKRINRLAFSNTALSDFSFGDSYTFISNEAFDGCSFTPNYPSYLTERSDGYYLVDQLRVKGDISYSMAYQVLDLVNQERSKRGLNALQMDSGLLDAAMARAFETSIGFSHTRPTGESCLSASSKMVGENIASGQWSPEDAMDSWMNSSGHRANILDSDYRSVGIGCVNVSGTYYWVQCFGVGAADACDQPSDCASTVAKIDYTKQGLDELGSTFNLVPVTPDGSERTWNNDTSLGVGSSQRYALTVQPWSWATTFILDDCVSWAADSSETVALDSNTPTITAKKGGDYTLTASLVGGTGTITRSVSGKVVAMLSRLAGGTRYQTMGAVVDAGSWKKGGTAIVASAINFPDALAAATLAGDENAPILLTDPDSLSPEVASRLSSLLPAKVYIVGGSSAVSDTVKSQISKKVGSGCAVTRIAGGTRYGTALKLLEETSGRSKTLIVATGVNFADALSVSPYAFESGAPIVLSDPGSGLDADLLDEIRARGFTSAIIVGGTSAVPEKVESQLSGAGIVDVARLSGSTRFETSKAIAEYELSHGFKFDGVVFATGINFPDALAAGALAGKSSSPVLLVGQDSDTAVSFAKQYYGQVSAAYVVGGTSAVSDDEARSLASALGMEY